MILGKRIVTNPNEDEGLLELGESCIKYEIPLEIQDVITVEAFQAGKPWLISRAYYRTENFTDTLCFFNGYADPFRVAEGDIMLIPTSDSLNRATRDNNANYEEIGQPILINDVRDKRKQKQPRTDQRRLELLKKLASQGNLEEVNKIINQAPNESNGVSKIVANDGQIVLGTDISSKRCENPNLSAVQSKTERIRKAVQDRLVGVG